MDMVTIPTELEGEFCIRLRKMPKGSRGCVILDENGFYNIYVNEQLPLDEQRDAADHELEHIINDDFYNADDIGTVERRADGRLMLPEKIRPLLVKCSDLIQEQVPATPAPAPAPIPVVRKKLNLKHVPHTKHRDPRDPGDITDDMFVEISLNYDYQGPYWSFQ